MKSRMIWRYYMKGRFWTMGRSSIMQECGSKRLVFNARQHHGQHILKIISGIDLHSALHEDETNLAAAATTAGEVDFSSKSRHGGKPFFLLTLVWTFSFVSNADLRNCFTNFLVIGKPLHRNMFKHFQVEIIFTNLLDGAARKLPSLEHSSGTLMRPWPCSLAKY